MKTKNRMVHKRLSLFGGRLLLELRIYALGAGDAGEICAAVNVSF